MHNKRPNQQMINTKAYLERLETHSRFFVIFYHNFTLHRHMYFQLVLNTIRYVSLSALAAA